MDTLITTSVGAITEPTVPGEVIRYSDYRLDVSSPYAGGCAWIEGEYLPVDRARISIFDTGFGHSDVTYTVASVWHGNFFRLTEHIDRLVDGAEHHYRLTTDVSRQQMAEIATRCVVLSQLREAYVCLAITRGYGARRGEKDLNRLISQLYVYAIPYLWVFSPEEQILGVSAVVPRKVRRVGRNSIDPAVKNFQWGDLVQASFEASDRGARTAILLDADGCVTEGPGFNVCVVKDGLITSAARNALPGITRRTAYELAERMGVPAVLGDVPLDALYDADEVFTTTTAGGITPVTSVDGVAVGTGEAGPVTVALRTRFWQLMDEPSPLVTAVNYDEARP